MASSAPGFWIVHTDTLSRLTGTLESNRIITKVISDCAFPTIEYKNGYYDETYGWCYSSVDVVWFCFLCITHQLIGLLEATWRWSSEALSALTS